MSLELITYIAYRADSLSVEMLQDRVRPAAGVVDREGWLVTPLTATEVRAEEARISTNVGLLEATHSVFTAVSDKSGASAAIEESLRLLSAVRDSGASDFATIYCGGPLVAASFHGELFLDTKSGFWSVPARPQILRGPAVWVPLHAGDIRERGGPR
ncbi:MAG: hypothetical protein VYE22_41875 [Myxococcota bacterium]|nr:hypothetical protein [Myxococcota bacterium]